MVKGGCLCGEVRFSIQGEPLVQLYCYCSDCRKVSGTDGYAAYVVPRSALTLDKGKPTGYSVTAKSGGTNTRNFCSKCGSRLWADLKDNLASVSGGAFDDPETFTPTMVHCENDAPSWGRVPESLPSLPET